MVKDSAVVMEEGHPGAVCGRTDKNVCVSINGKRPLQRQTFIDVTEWFF